MADLKAIIGEAYREMVLEHGKPINALSMFTAASVEDGFIQSAKQRLADVDGIHDQCFMSKVEHEFLTMALERPVPSSSSLLPPVSFHNQDHEEMTSKLSTLADLAKTTIAEVEADAEAEVTKLLAAKTRANAAVANVGTIRTGMESGAKELEDFANQLTNGGPPLGS